jgi:hypothetical protein
MGTEDSFAGVEGPGEWIWPLTPSSVDVKIEWSYTSVPPLFSFTGRIPAEASDLPPLEDVQIGPGVHKISCSVGAVCPEVERPACATDHSPPSDADLKDVSGCTYSNPPFARTNCRKTTSICMQKPAPTCQIHTHLTGCNMRLCRLIAISCMQRL